MLAAAHGKIGVVQLLLANDAKVNVKTTENVYVKVDDGTTASMLAAEYGRSEITRLLLAKGADVNAKNKDGTTAIMHCR